MSLAYTSLHSSPSGLLMRLSNDPDSRMIPRRMKANWSKYLKYDTLLVTMILALVSSKPPGPMT